MMEHCVARQCFWAVVLSVHVCCKTCIMSRLYLYSVSLKHILPQRFTTQLLVQTLRKIDQLPRSTEASVRESTDPRIIELIPGLQDARKKTLPQMYFEDCSVFRGTYGRVNLLFQHPEDAVLLIWKPGDYETMTMFTSCLCHSCIHIMNSSKSMNGV